MQAYESKFCKLFFGRLGLVVFKGLFGVNGEFFHPHRATVFFQFFNADRPNVQVILPSIRFKVVNRPLGGNLIVIQSGNENLFKILVFFICFKMNTSSFKTEEFRI